MGPVFMKEQLLSVARHDRDVAGMRYVYPVVSRRAGGISVGVNLNPNHACNWRCIYCQVPKLVLGKGPPVDLSVLRTELSQMLHDIVHGSFLDNSVPEAARRLSDVAISGNGEPTTSPQFDQAVTTIGEVLEALDLVGRVKLVLITNGSLLDRTAVRAGVSRIAELGGELWFKLDSATVQGSRSINRNPVAPEAHLARLRRAAELCPTWIQTCLFAWKGQPPSADEQRAYLQSLGRLARDAVPVRGVLLYSLARESQQPEASELEPLPSEWLQQFARQIEQTGFTVQISP